MNNKSKWKVISSEVVNEFDTEEQADMFKCLCENHEKSHYHIPRSFEVVEHVDISTALCERDRYCVNCGNIQNKKWDECLKCHHTHIDEEGLHSIEIK